MSKILDDFLMRMLNRRLLFDLPPTERDWDDLIIDLKELRLKEEE